MNLLLTLFRINYLKLTLGIFHFLLKLSGLLLLVVDVLLEALNLILLRLDLFFELLPLVNLNGGNNILKNVRNQNGH